MPKANAYVYTFSKVLNFGKDVLSYRLKPQLQLPLATTRNHGIKVFGDFIINPGKTVNMEAGTSIKIQSGFKLCNGANIKASVDGSKPVLKSSAVEQLSTPVIAGKKYVSVGDVYTTNKSEYDNIFELFHQPKLTSV